MSLVLSQLMSSLTNHTYLAGMMNGLQRERLRTTQWRVFQYQLVFISCWAPSKQVKNYRNTFNPIKIISGLILAVMTTVEWVKGSDLYNGKDKTPTYYFVLYYIQVNFTSCCVFDSGFILIVYSGCNSSSTGIS